MAFGYFQRKIDHLRQQPEDKRLRAATLLTAGSGGILVVLWLAILLPLQIRLNAPDSEPTDNQAALSPTVSPAAQQLAAPLPANRQVLTTPLTPDVAGLRTASPAPQLPLATPLISPSPSSIVATPAVSPTPVEP